MDELVYKIITSVVEDYDNFIFETIKPFCENVTQMKIEKRDLENALLKSKPRKITVVYGKDICPSCHLDITNSVQGIKECYCKKCGQHIIRSFQ